MSRSSRSVRPNASAVVRLRGSRTQHAFAELVSKYGLDHHPRGKKDRTAVDARTLQRVESGIPVDRQTLKLIADAGGVTFESLLAAESCIPERVDFSRLPKPASQLFGRDSELYRISEAIKRRKVSVVAIAGFGGIGKSALVYEWLNRARPDYSNTRQVFGWSFYDQGTHSPETDSRPFFDAALPFLGFTGTMPNTESGKGRQLADLLKQKPTLLILDGVEPLQDRLDVTNGYLRDPGLRAFFDAIMSGERLRSTHGSCVLVTSRQPLVELASLRKGDFESVELKSLNQTMGAKLLREMGLRAQRSVLVELAKQFGGHPLALVLLGHLLAVDYEQRAALVRSIPLFADPKSGGHAKRVMRAYEKLWTAKAPQNVFLRLIGLFDRPVTQVELDVLLGEHHEFTRPLKALSANQWQTMESSLKHAGLLSDVVVDGRKGWDTHPIVRAYFGEQFREERPAIWRSSHKALQKHFEAIPTQELPGTLSEIEPLYRAVHHGCLAEEYAHAWRAIMNPRILRGAPGYSGKVLGAISANLAALSRFFPKGEWSEPATKGLAKNDVAWILAHTTFSLMSLLRLNEMMEPLRVEERMFTDLHQWDVVVDVALQIVDAELLRGQLPSALDEALKGIATAERIKTSSPTYQARNGVIRCQLASALHQLGRFSESRAAYEEAERFQGKELFSARGYRYCSLLVETHMSDEDLAPVEQRARRELSAGGSELLRVAVGHLTRGLYLLATDQLSEALTAADSALDVTRKGSRDIYTLDALLLRAEVLRKAALKDRGQNDLRIQASNDVGLVIKTARRFELPLYLADALALETHLNLDFGNKASGAQANESFRKFSMLVTRHFYGRRYLERELLRARVAHRNGDLARAAQSMQKAENLLRQNGQLGMMAALTRVKEELRR